MHSFKDTNGKTWVVKIDAPKISEVRKALDFNLTAKDGTVFDKLAEDEVLLIDTLWVLVRDQADSTTDVQFGRAMFGDCIEAATNALTDALLDFFPAGKRGLLRNLREKQAAMVTEATKLVQEKINDPALQEEFLTLIRKQLSTDLESLFSIGSSGATSKPVSSASAPTA